MRKVRATTNPPKTATSAIEQLQKEAAMALCAKGKELLRELQRSDWLPPYNVRFPDPCL